VIPIACAAGVGTSAWRTVTYLCKRALLRIEELSHTRSILFGQIDHCPHTGQPRDEQKASQRLRDSPGALSRGPGVVGRLPKISGFQFDSAGTGLCCWAAEPGTRAAASIPQNAHGK
jgi:hypothetical protein